MSGFNKIFCLVLALSAWGLPSTAPALAADEENVGAQELVMILIQVDAGPQLKKLRGMPLDIIRIRPHSPGSVGGKRALRRALVVEAVADYEMARALERMGYDVEIVGPTQSPR